MKDSDVLYENHLLNASGVLAIVLTGFITASEFDFWPEAFLYLAFTAGFLVLAYRDRLSIPEHHQHRGFFLLIGISILCWYLYPTGITLILTVVLMAQAPYLFTRRQCWHLLLANNGIFVVLISLYIPQQDVFMTWLSMFALQAFAMTSSLARHREFLLRQQLSQQNAELIAARAALAKQSQTEERLRIAGDLHDGIGHQLTALRLQLEAIIHQAPESLKSKLNQSQRLSEELLENIRTIVKRMSDFPTINLASTIQELNNTTPGVDIQARTEIPLYEHTLAQQLEYCLKEGINNAIRHGRANRIEISADSQHLFIDDNGSLTNKKHKLGFGLTNLINRLEKFQGQVELVPKHSGGYRLSISFTPGSVK